MTEPITPSRPIVLYGKGPLGMLTKEIFDKHMIPVAAHIDRNDFTRGTPSKAEKELKKEAVVIVCIASEPYNPIRLMLRSKGWGAEGKIRRIYDVFEQHPELGITSGWKIGKLSHEDRSGIARMLPKFADNTSNRHWVHFTTWHRGRGDMALNNMEHRECLPSTLADIEARRHVFLCKDEPMGSVSIHAEGYELDTILVNMPLFQKHRPKIDAACYHTRDGLWKIEKALMDGLPNYRWTFRVHAYQGQGAYVYGVPTEKIEMAETLHASFKSPDFHGITLCHRDKKWRADVYVDRKKYYGGIHKTPELAARAYDGLAVKLLGDKAWLNFPKEDK